MEVMYGENSYINANIGKYCSISSNVRTVIGRHPTKTFVSTHPAFYSAKGQAGFSYVKNDKYEEFMYADGKDYVKIGNDVWIGSGAIILDGVTIGDGAIIAAGAVVNRDVEPYSIVGGIPARTIRSRFEAHQIEQLIKLEWWNNSEDWIFDNINLFENIDRFLEKCRREK